MWAIVRFAKCQPCLGEFSGEIKAQYFLTHSFHRSAVLTNIELDIFRTDQPCPLEGVGEEHARCKSLILFQMQKMSKNQIKTASRNISRCRFCNLYNIFLPENHLTRRPFHS